MEMSITRALNELKLLDSRITRAIQQAKFIAVQTGNNKINGHQTVEDFNVQALSAYQSIVQLIKRRDFIKAAIVKSNAETPVKIAGKEMTVAGAIERKTSITYQNSLLQVFRSGYNTATSKVVYDNESVKERLDKHIETMLGKESKGKEDQVENLSKSFNDLNQSKLIDPLNLSEKIKTLTEEIEDFMNEVDFVLSESNVKTTIEVPEQV